jgi:hypothetical protein
VTFTLLFIGLLILIPIVIGVAYVARNASAKRGRTAAEPKKAEPVTLDRNPEMPHRPGATS